MAFNVGTNWGSVPENQISLWSLAVNINSLKRMTIAGTSFILCAGLLFVGCNAQKPDQKAKKDDDKGKQEKKVEEAVPVEVIALTRGSLESTLNATANLVAEESIMVPSRTSNRAFEILVEEGDEVKANQVLVRLENQAQKTALERTEVQLEKARREFTRTKSLYDQNLISTQEYNNATTTVEDLELTLKDNQRELDYTIIRAPISGTITQRLVKLGDQVNPNQNLFEIVDFNSIVARIFVPEKHLPSLKENLKARISSTSINQEAYSGKVLRVAPTVDAQTGTIKVTVALDSLGLLRPGMFVDVDLILEVRPNALLIPKKALVYDDADMYVFSLKDDMTVVRKQVLPRLTDRLFVEPISGFSDGESIIVAGQAGLKDGAKVRIPEPTETVGSETQDISQKTEED